MKRQERYDYIRITYESLDTVIERAKEISAKHGCSFREMSFSADEEFDCLYVKLEFERPETDEEMKARIEREKKWNESQKELRRQQFEQLKKEFGE